MADFAKQPPADDMAPVPVMPNPDVPAIKEDQDEDDQATAQQAAPFWHPAWAKVEERFNEILDAYDGNNVMQYKDLPDPDFKIKVLAQQTVRLEILSIVKDVKDAVEAIERQPNRPKQSKRAKQG